MKKNAIIYSMLLISCGSGNVENPEKRDTIASSLSARNQETSTSTANVPDSAFLVFWNQFKDIVKASNRASFKKVSFDSVKYELKTIPTDEFMKNAYNKVFNDALISQVDDSAAVTFSVFSVEKSYFPTYVDTQVNNDLDVVKKVYIKTTYKQNKIPVIILLEFIETKTGHKFFRYDRYG